MTPTIRTLSRRRTLRRARIETVHAIMPLLQIIARRAAHSYWFSRQPSGDHCVCRVSGKLGNRATAHGASIRVVG
jgi:hypothetical protein